MSSLWPRASWYTSHGLRGSFSGGGMKRGWNRVLDPAEDPAAFTAKTLISMAFGIVASAGRVHLITVKYILQ